MFAVPAVLQGMHTKAPLCGVAAAPGADGNPRSIHSCGVTALSIITTTSSSSNSSSSRDVGVQTEAQEGRIWCKVSHANGAELLRQLGVFEFQVTSGHRLR
jgi:hypothetical protein